MFYFVQQQHTKSRLTYRKQYKKLFTYYDASSVAKKITEEILHKIYTEKGEITGIWLVLPTIEVRKEITRSQLATR